MTRCEVAPSAAGASPTGTSPAGTSIEQNIAAYWLSLGRAPRGFVHQDADVTWAYTGRPVLNRVVATAFDAGSADARIDEVVGAYERLGADFAWLVGPSASPADLPQRLVRRGLQDAGAVVGMALDLVAWGAWEDGDDPSGLQVREVAADGEADRAYERAWLAVVGRAFELPDAALAVLREACAGPAAGGEEGCDLWRRFVGYVGGRPVATATLVPAAGVAGIYLVGTIPEEERQGLATALTRHALRRARADGFTTAVLEVAPDVQPLYDAMGFQERCRLRIFKWAHPRGVVRRLVGRAGRLARNLMPLGTTSAAALLGLALLSACAAPPAAPQAGPEPPTPLPAVPTSTPPSTATPPPTPTPDTRGAIAERRQVGVFSTQQINQLQPRLYSGGTSLPARHAVEQHTLRFTTTEESGATLHIVAQLYVPQIAAGQAPKTLPVVVYGSGTTGLGDHCAPSREQPAVRNWGDYHVHMLSYAAQGYVSIIPDYAGFNDETRLHRYFIADSEARVMFDAARAVYRYLQEAPLGGGGSTGWTVFLGGYSQGGHAAFAARDVWPRYAPDVPLRGVIGHGASTDLTALLKDSPYFAPYVLFSLADYYGPTAVDVSKLLATRWLPTLAADVTSKCIDQMPTYYGNTPQALYQPAFSDALFNNRLETAFPTVKETLDKNSTGLAPSDIPALVIQGGGDPIVQQRSSDAFVAKLCAAGGRVTYVSYPGVHHFQVRQVGFKETMAWMETLMGGGTPRNTCPAR